MREAFPYRRRERERESEDSGFEMVGEGKLKTGSRMAGRSDGVSLVANYVRHVGVLDYIYTPGSGGRTSDVSSPYLVASRSTRGVEPEGPMRQYVPIISTDSVRSSV